MSAKEISLPAAQGGPELSREAHALALSQRENERLAALDGYFLLDTANEAVYDAITQLAASICDVPIALISLVDRDRQWFKSTHGLPGVYEIPRAGAFGAQAILRGELMEIADVAQDARFRTNPLVASEPRIRFYAEMPLINADGHALGALCVIDRQPRRMTQAQRAALHHLSEVVIGLFELRKSEATAAQLAGILDKSSNEIFVVDPKTLRFLHVSESAQRNLQYTLDELKQLTPFDLVVGFTREQIDKTIAPLRTGAPQVTAHAHLRRKDGSQYPVEARMQMSDSSGASMYFAIANDITARRRNRERMAHLSRARTVLAECNRTLAHVCDERQLLEQLCRIAAGAGGYSMAWIGMVEKNDERRTVIPVAHAGYGKDYLDSIPASWHAGAQGDGPVSNAVRSRRTCTSQNIMDDPTCAPWRDAAARLGFAACVALPLTDRADCIGCLVIYADEPYAFDGDEIALLEELAVDIAHGICASRSRVARLLSEARGGERSGSETEQCFRATFNQAAVGITHTTLEGRFLRVNRKFCEMLGYEETELYNLAPGTLTHSDDRFRHKQDKARLCSGKSETFSNEKRYLHKDGNVLWVRVTMSVVRDIDGKPEYFLGVVEDISERKRAEAALKKQNGLRVLLESLAVSANQAATPEQALRECLSRICSYGEWPIGHVVMFGDADYSAAGQSSMWRFGDAERYAEFKRISDPPVIVPDGGGFLARCIASRRALWITDLSELEQFERKKVALRLGLKTAFVFPVITGNRVVACLEFFSERELEPDTALIDVTTNIGAQLGRVTERCEAEIALRESEERFRAVVNQVSVGIVQFGLDGRYLLINDEYCKITGYYREQLVTMTTRDLISPMDYERSLVMRDRLLKGEMATVHAERRVRHKTGEYVWVAVTTSLARGPDGTPRHFISVIEDMTQRKNAADALQRSEARYRMLFEASPIPMWVHESGTFRILAVNDAAVKLYGYSRDEFLATVASIVAPEDQRSKPMEYWHDADDQAVSVRRRTHQTKHGHVIEAETTTCPFDFNGQRAHLVVINDITEQQRAERALRESEEQFQQLANNIPQMCWITDASQRKVVYLSPAFETITGCTAEVAKANSRILVKIVHPDDRRRIQVARRNAAIGGYDEIFRLVRPDGSIRWMHDRAFPIRDASGQVYRVAGIAEDITERKHAEERVLHLAHYDALTNLPNRVLCYDRLKQALAQARRNAWSVAVMFVDLDRFKNVNDTLGHAIGDTLLQQASERLSRCIRSGDTVGRYGGDEFIVILSNLNGAQDTGVVAQKITAAFAEPFMLNDSHAYVTASIGIALYPGDSSDQDELVRDADTAMYRAKELGRNNFQFYRASMNERAHDKLYLENDLRGALERHEFRLYYQPKASLSGGEITGFEALIRWQHPERGLVSPVEFVPLLEETGLIGPVGAWVIRAACAQIKAWKDAGIQPAPVAVNLSARQFQSPDLGTMIIAMLDEFKLEPQLLELEITESSLMHNTEDAVRTLKHLEALGLRISIDDFGTGYSSLAYLKRFPLHALKIDRAFVKDIGQDSDDTAITLALISMAHNLGLKVIAEGVETEEQLTFLSANACDEIQGYYFAEPLAASECTEFLRQKKRLPRLTQRRDAQPASILLVDDDEDALLLLKRILNSNEYEILIATSARQALKMLSEHNVKVVVSDQQMPGMSGVEFLQRVRSLFPDTVRVMLSGHTEFDTVSNAINKGEIFRFLAKSWDKEQLRRDIREAFELGMSGRGKLISIKGGRPTAA